MQRAILSYPGSDGLTSIAPMLDHLWSMFPKTSREAFIDEVGTTLVKLRRLGALYLERHYGVERLIVTVDEWENFSLRKFVVWDRDTQRWAVNSKQANFQPALLKT